MAQIPAFPSLDEFVFNMPLYSPVSLSGNWSTAIELFRGRFMVDGYCRECGLPSTFRRVDASGYAAGVDLRVTDIGDGFRTFEVGCARDSDHRIRVYAYIDDDLIQKVGQFPSLADIANDETKTYRRVLSPQDGHELHKAIGLAAHGVGIGSYVYLRRIFERLIKKRFDEFKAVEKWKDDHFSTLRMNEKIDLLRDHLPRFMVENSRVYGILSVGIHELAEEQCLGFFPVLKGSLIMILEEDEETRKKLEQKKQLKAAIDKFNPSTDRV